MGGVPGVVAGLALSSGPTPLLAAPAVGQFANGSFETGDYAGWTLWERYQPIGYPYPYHYPTFGTWGIATNGQVIPLGAYVFDHYDLIQVNQGSPGLPHTYTATDGNYVALQLQNGGETHRMWQDITLPAGVNTVSWDLEYWSHAGGFQPGHQMLLVTIRNPGTDAVLATLYQTAPGSPVRIPMTHVTADVPAFGGQTVRFSVDMYVYSFFFDAAFDHFKVDIILVRAAGAGAINLKALGVTPVTVYSEGGFDATTIDFASVAFGPAGARESHGKLHAEDVDADVDLDAVFHFNVAETGIECGATSADITGLAGGQQFKGTTNFKTNGCK